MVFFQPFSVRIGGSKLRFDLFIGNDPSLLRIDQEHVPRLNAPLAQDALRSNFQNAGFGSHDNQVVSGDVVAGRAQAVAVEHRADNPPIGKGDCRRAIPWLHQTGVIFVKGPFFRTHLRVIFPWFRRHHHNGMRQAAATHDEQLQAVVEHGRIRTIGIDDRQCLFDVIAE